jgi:hypothetical protein
VSTLVRLEPPYTRSSGWRPAGHHALPLTRGPRLVRTAAMGRWHRPRSGTWHRRPDWTHTTLATWCGQLVILERALTATAVPHGEPLCGTCEGRAVGAGHPPIGVELRAALLFEPATAAAAPARCPARLLGETAARRFPWRGTFPCPCCGESTRLRAAGGPYDSRVVIESHPPGPDLYRPCPFHRWDRPRLADDGRVVCGCTRDAA